MRWLAAILALIGATSVSAQVMPVRSGEHDGFTRFTIRIDKGEDWSIETIGSQVRFRSGDVSAKYDLTSVFDRISRNRITAVSQTDPGSALVFEMNCACQVTPFLSGDSLVVIDFRDPIQEEASGFQLPIPSPGGFAFQLPADRALSTIPPAEENNSADAEIASVALPIDLVRAPLSARTIEDRFSGIGNAAVSAMEQQLIQQLTRAEQQGLIEARSRTDMPSDGDNTHLSQPEKTEEPDPKPSLRNLAVTTSIDRDLAGVAVGLMRPAEATRCIPTSRLNMQDWATDAPFSAQIGHWRSAMVGEFDRVDPKIVESLVRTYLYFGFGVEARQALGLARPQLENHSIYDAMAHIMDGGEAPSENPFSGLQGCKSDAALWAALSEPDRLDMLNDEAVQKAASRLPPNVRQLVGPRLALEFARGGRTGSAEGVLRSVDRTAEPPTPELALAHASAAELRGEPELAKEKRIEVAMNDNEHSPTALIEAIDMAAQAKEQVPPDLVNLAEAYVTEFRNSEISEPLERAMITALALNGDFARAFKDLESYASHEDRDAIDLRVPLLDLMTERAADLDFLRQGLQQTAGVEDELPESLSNAMAERFLDLGFARPAQRLLAGANANPPSRERRILRAKAALAANLPREALVAILGLSGPDVTELRAEAALQTRNHSQAAYLFAETGRDDQAVRSSWLGDTPSADIPAPSEERYREIFEQIGVLSDVSGTASEQTPLMRAETLIEQSNTTRDGIRALLEAVSVN